MPRSTRAKAQARTRATPVKPESSSDSASFSGSASGSASGSSSASSRPARPGGDAGEASALDLKGIDAAILALILGFALLMIAGTGFANGQELWPIPDAVEYAAIAVNLNHGLGPVLHFGGHSYPCRYTIGYPLILAAAYPLLRLLLIAAGGESSDAPALRKHAAEDRGAAVAGGIRRMQNGADFDVDAAAADAKPARPGAAAIIMEQKWLSAC